MQDLYYNTNSSSITLFPEGYVRGKNEKVPIEYLDISSLIVCSSLLEIHAIDQFNSLVAAFPIENTNLFYGAPPINLFEKPIEIEQQLALEESVTFVNYDYTTNDTSSLFKIEKYNVVGDQYANTTIMLSGSLGYNKIVTVSYRNPTPSLQSYTYFTEFSSSTISGSTIDIQPYLYLLETGSSASDSAYKFTTAINRSLSGSFASSSVNLLNASSSGAIIYVSASNPGTFYNDYYIEIGSLNITSQSITLVSASKYYLSNGSDTYSLSGSLESIAFLTQSLAQNIQLPVENVYHISVSSSNLPYVENRLTIINTTTNTKIFDVFGSYSSSLSASITSSYNTTYDVIASSTALPYLELTYTDTGSFPVSPTNSLDSWNSYLNVPSSKIELIGSSVDLIGRGLTDTLFLYISESRLTNFKASNLQSLSICSISGSGSVSLTKYPIFDNCPRLTILDLENHQGLSGSLPISVNGSNNLQTLKIKKCKFTGSVAFTSLLNTIRDYDCSYNDLSGSISLLPLYLENFNSGNNHLTGSIPSLTNNRSLARFTCNNNKLSNYVSGSMPSTITYFNAENNLLSQSAVDAIIKELYATGAPNGYLNLSGSGNSSASFDAFQTASLLSIERGWDTRLNGYTFDADFLVVTYQFDSASGGTDLDIRTRIVSPVGTKYHGYACNENSPPFNAALTVPPNISQTSYTSSAPYLYWSGDNTGYGVESMYVDLSSSFSASDVIQLECRAFWFGAPTLGSMSLDIEAYKGGYISQSGFQFQNVGGTQVANLTLPYVVTASGGGAANIGQKLGDLYYNRATNTLSFV